MPPPTPVVLAPVVGQGFCFVGFLQPCSVFREMQRLDNCSVLFGAGRVAVTATFLCTVEAGPYYAKSRYTRSETLCGRGVFSGGAGDETQKTATK